ncbi:MAG: 50S ribosomal protein L1 [Alphaproteobacteria bacterium MarineAlpha5_Bin12]|mgnify:CR=1 FL=1|nr:50S ribosomal protein L1 [Pelagibacteraceae bacterium]PPR42122.1 MAG: 50S ribosomal protein L1 [Alphaproteobacteria bacterium MarineAlpha5_Bin12]|tara:strand:- start:26058 stop:26756 length:699 start_codon:yes stop_codon:yes gene_type:complete
MKKISKKMKDIYSKIDKERNYNLDEAIDLIKNSPAAKFEETLDIAINLSLNAGKTDQSVRGVINLPHGTGKNIRIAVVAKDENASKARESGADIVGDTDFIKSIESGEINFDRLIATPDMMPQLAKIGQILGPKGLMPNPKLGTVTNDVSKAIKDAKKGQVQFKNDKSGIIHAGVGKLSFDKEKLRDNIKTFFEAILKNKPEGIKGSYVKRVSIASTMGIGIKLNVADLQKN